MLLSPVTWPRCTRQSSPSSMWPVGIAWPGRMMMDQRLAASTVAQGTILRSEEHTSELQSLMRISYAVFCLKKKKTNVFTRHEDHTAELCSLQHATHALL